MPQSEWGNLGEIPYGRLQLINERLMNPMRHGAASDATTLLAAAAGAILT